MEESYCKEPSTHGPVSVLGSLIKQLALQNERAFENLETFYKSHNHKGKPTILPKAEELCTFLQSMTTCFGNALIIVDALHECVKDRSHVSTFFEASMHRVITTSELSSPAARKWIHLALSPRHSAPSCSAFLSFTGVRDSAMICRSFRRALLGYNS
jgi:hypothetical protein